MNVAKKDLRRLRRKKSIRNTVGGTPERLRLTVFKSAKHIYAQIIDDTASQTMVSVSSLEKDVSEKLASVKGKVEASKVIGSTLAERALAKDIKSVVFDRNGYVYHGRVKALADAAREGGLDF